MFHSLHHAVQVLKVFPDESPDPCVLQYSFFFAQWQDVLRSWTMYWYIIDVRLGNMWNLSL